MKFQSFLFVGVTIELCLLPLIDAKRTFGITRSRNKNKGPSVRRNQQGHDFDDGPLPPVHPKPSMPELRKPVNYSPIGPAPGYLGMGSYHSPAPYGAPPAYSQNHASPNGYSRFGQNPGSFGQPGYHQNQFSPYGGGMPLGGAMPISAGMSGPIPMGVMPIGSPRSSGMGSGIMTNLFAGLAGYQLAKAFSGGHRHRDREILVIDNRQPINADPSHSSSPVEFPVAPEEILPNLEIPSSETSDEYQETYNNGRANNEYNFYGVPQYGVPLYGYSLPSQIKDYYQTAVFLKHQQNNQETYQ